ncbi:hypothetical protein BDN72DRAFT_953770 [Pluteus cervinus]|uniref:Uncharacterized protein n=1 Tax=Pluteus cervinus TaxID=181527 RepID=A0ACD3BHJ3_9AGAR|nr:hypothetical protein BDN72DRAFT_953770 [Pluteus cervinus]
MSRTTWRRNETAAWSLRPFEALADAALRNNHKQPACFLPSLHLDMARSVLSIVLVWALAILRAVAFQVDVLDTDYTRQTCSGMWGGKSTFINITFDAASQGQLAMLVYEWSDAQYLGKVTDPSDEYLPKTYVCTSSAVSTGFCAREDLGRFILDLPQGMSINDTSFWSGRVHLHGGSSNGESQSGFWDNPEGNPTPPVTGNESPWRKRATPASGIHNPSPPGTYHYDEPIQYLVRKTGYYCVAIVPVTVQPLGRADTDVAFHPSYRGTVLFQNVFNGQLAAGDYPKVNFYFAMFVVYGAAGAVWAWLCYKNAQDLLPLQYYLSGLVGLLVIEMLARWGYYRYLNAHGRSTTAIIFLIVVAILEAGRNSMSFFMLLLVSLGLSVFRESLGRTMLKCQILAGAHFIFGVLYAVGIVELELRSTSSFMLLLFIIPLALSLTTFLLWIMYSLSATVTHLHTRKQRYKGKMFQRLTWILRLACAGLVAFFLVSSVAFSGRLSEDYASKSWRLQWLLLDGWLALLYLCAFSSISYLWRPSSNNRRLVLSDEIAQDEEDAEDYDMDALEHRTRAREEDDNATLVGSTRGALQTDRVVFEIGDEDEDDPATPKRQRPGRSSVDDGDEDDEDEREGLMNSGPHRSRND